MTSRSTTIAAALGMVLGCGTLLATTSMAGAPQGAVRAAQSESETVSGVIEEVNADSNEFVLKVKEAAERADETSVTIKVNDETRYTLDGKDSTMVEALQSGRTATVTHRDKVASMVAVQAEKMPGS